MHNIKLKTRHEIIQFQGQLDKQSVKELWQKIIQKSSLGNQVVSIDMFGAGPVLAEGVFEMQSCWNDFANSLSSRVIFRNFNERAEQTFQMYGIAFSNRQAVFMSSDETEPYNNAEKSNQPYGIMRCPSCRINLRIWNNGWNACPSCGMKFKSNF